MTRAETLEIQRQLGLKADGIYGPKTAQAYQRWLNANTPYEINMPTPAPKPAAHWWRHKVVIGLLATALAGITSRWGVDADEQEIHRLTTLQGKVDEIGRMIGGWIIFLNKEKVPH